MTSETWERSSQNHRLDVRMRQEVRISVERRICREYDEEIRAAIQSPSASDYLRENK